MQKILLLSQFLNPGGLERLVLSLSRELKQSTSWMPVVFSYDEIPGQLSLAQEFASFGVEVKQVRKKKGFSFQTLFMLWRYIRSEQIKVVHSHDLGPWVYAILIKVMTLGKVRVVHTQHSRVYFQGDWKSEIYEQICLKFTDEVVWVSENVGSDAPVYKNCHNKINIIENGVKFPDLSLLSREAKVNLRKDLLSKLSNPLRRNLDDFVGSYWILCLGRIHPGKGQEHVLSIWKNLSIHSRKKAILLFIGPETVAGRVRYLQELGEELPDCNRIFFLGGTTIPEKWILASHVFVSGSESEGMPLAPIEASGSGLPVLLSEIEGHVRLDNLPKGSTKLFPISHPEIAARWLERQIEEVSRDEFNYYSKVWSDTSVVRDRFGLPRMIDGYTALYDASILGS